MTEIDRTPDNIRADIRRLTIEMAGVAKKLNAERDNARDYRKLAGKTDDPSEKNRLEGNAAAADKMVSDYTLEIGRLGTTMFSLQNELNDIKQIGGESRLQNDQRSMAGFHNKQERAPSAISPAKSPVSNFRSASEPPGLNFPGARQSGLNAPGFPGTPAGRIGNAQAPTMQTLNPHPLGPNGEIPTLIRRDQQPLSKPEVLYPEMSYRENEHEPWSNEAIAKATQLYPDLPQKIAA
jgi:hypothetical protein